MRGHDMKKLLSAMLIACMLFSTALAHTVYSGAVNAFFQPVEDYSSKRKHPPEVIMIHFTSAIMERSYDPFNMKAIRQILMDHKVSIHYIIDRKGVIYCWIPEERVAWHAGKGKYGNEPKYTNQMNHYSIGIEMVAIGSKTDMAQYLKANKYDTLPDSWKGYTDAQYESLKQLVDDLCSRYNIPADRDHVIGHQDYTAQKNDPGELFDWKRILPNVD